MFEKIDLLGPKFHFYDGLSLKRRTTLGGILTLFLILSSIFLFFIFGNELFNRINPIITISIQNDSIYEIIDLYNEQISFAFRLEDFDGHYINELNKLYFKIDYYSFEQSHNGKYKNYSNGEKITFHICNESDFKHKNLSEHYGTLYCPDLGGKKFGGYWDNPYIYFFEFQIFFCENGNNYSINNKCTSLNDLRKLLDKNIYFSLYYPVVQFNPLSYNQPLKIKYKNYYFDLHHKNQRRDEIFLKKTILNDDKGFLLKKIKNISLWGIDKISSSFKYYPEDELINESSSSKIYSMIFYSSVEKNYFTRTYTKFQNVFAILGTIINILLNVCLFITYIFGESFRKIEVLNNFFEFEEKNDLGFNIIKKNFTQNFNSKIFIIPKPNKNNKLKIKKNNQFKTTITNSQYEKKIQEDILKNSNIKENNNIYIYGANNDYKKNNTNQSNSKLVINNNRRTSLPLSTSNTLINNKYNNNFIKSNLSLKTIIKENIKIYCFFCCSNKKNYTQYINVKHAHLLQYYYIKLIQINRYLRNVQEFDFLKKIFLNNHQIKSLFFLKRINLTNRKERDEILENKNSPYIENNIIDYFKNQISLNNLSKIDKLILNNLSDHIKEKIL